HGRGAHAATKEASDALLKANPQLKDINKVPVGSLIIIPDAAPAVPAEEQAISADLVRSFAVESVQATLDSLQKRLADIEAEVIERVKATTNRLHTKEMKAALKSLAAQGFPLAERAPSFDSIASSTAEFVKQVQKLQDAQKKTIA